MDVVERNFFRLLRSGTFDDMEPVEPMSEWKWNYIYRLSMVHGVTAVVWDGIEHHHDDFFMQLSDDQKQLWHETVGEIEAKNAAADKVTAQLFAEFNHLQLRPILLKGQGSAANYPVPQHRTSGDTDVYFPYEPQHEKADLWAEENGSEADRSESYKLSYKWQNCGIDHYYTPASLTNPLLDRRLQAIIDNEIRCCDSSYITLDNTRIETLPPTLNMLVALTRIGKYMLNDGVILKQLIDLGMYMRRQDEVIDYDKLKGWLNRLAMQRMANLIASLLVDLFNFDPAEMRFLEREPDEDVSGPVKDMMELLYTQNEEWYFTQGKRIFISSNNSGAMMWHIRHNLVYSRFYPAEAFTNFGASFIHSLSHIEE